MEETQQKFWKHYSLNMYYWRDDREYSNNRIEQSLCQMSVFWLWIKLRKGVLEILTKSFWKIMYFHLKHLFQQNLQFENGTYEFWEYERKIQLKLKPSWICCWNTESAKVHGKWIFFPIYNWCVGYNYAVYLANHRAICFILVCLPPSWL